MSRTVIQKHIVTTCIWWVGAILSACLVFLDTRRPDISHLLPTNPYHNTASGHAEQWRFLLEASSLVTPGSTFTIHAADPDTEMSLYMMAVGLLPDSTAVPRTDYGRPIEGSQSARFLLTFAAEGNHTAELQGSTAIRGGIVTDRRSAGR